MNPQGQAATQRPGSAGPGRGLRQWLGQESTCLFIGLLCLGLLACGCTPLRAFVDNGCKVGPNYQRPPAPLANGWIDANNPRVKCLPADYSSWWAEFRDPVLNDLVRTAYAQNVNLRIAATRVLEARATRAIAIGGLFPQQQTASGSFNHVQGA